MAGFDPLVQDENIRDSNPRAGFRMDYPLNLVAGRSDSANFPSLTNATSPSVVDGGSNCLAVRFGAGSTSKLLVPWCIPGEYDSAIDDLAVVLLATQTGGIDTISLSVSMSRAKSPWAVNQRFQGSPVSIGVAPGAVTTPGALSSTASVTTPVTYISRFSGKGLLPNDAVTIIVFPQNNTNDNFDLLGGYVRLARHAALKYEPERYNSLTVVTGV